MKIVLILLFITSSAVASVNTERLRTYAREEPGFSGHFEGSLGVIRGNNRVLDLGGNTRLQHETLYPSGPDQSKKSQQARWSRSLIFLSGSIRRAENQDGIFTDQGFAHLRWTRMWIPRLGSEFFSQYQFNFFQRLKLRQLFGGGIRWVLLNTVRFKSFYGTGYYFEIERLAPQDIPGEELNSDLHRWNNYFSLQWYSGEDRIRISSTTYAQPRIGRFSDYRILEEGEIRFKLTEQLSYGFIISYLYDSAPPLNVGNYDLSITQAARFEF